MTTQASQTMQVARNSELFDSLVMSGRVAREDGEFVASPQTVERDASGGELVTFALTPASSVQHAPAAWWRAIRAISLTATFMPCIATWLLGAYLGWSAHLVTAIAALLGSVLLQVSVNLLNDVEDHRRLIDLPGTLGGAGVIQKGELSARSVARASMVMLALGVLLGVPAFIRQPLPMTVVGVLAVIGTFGYSGRPFGFKYKALGDVTVMLLCGPLLTAGFSLAAFGRYDANVLALGVYFGAAAVGILHANNAQDIPVDRARGAVTLASIVGESASRWMLPAVYLVAWAGWAWVAKSAGIGWFSLIALLTLVPVLGLVSKVIRTKSLSDPSLAMLRIQAAQTHLAMGVAAALSLGVAYAAR